MNTNWARRLILATIYVALLPPGLLPETWLSAGVLLLLGLAAVVWLLRAVTGAEPVLAPPALTCLFVLFLWSILSLTWAPDLVLGRKALVQFAIVLAIAFLLMNEVRDRRGIDDFLRTLAAVGWTLVACAVWTLATEGHPPGSRLQVFDMNENMFGLVLILAAPGVLWPSLGPGPRSGRMPRVLGAMYLLASLVLILLSASRGGVIAFALLMGGFCALRSTRRWGGALVIAGGAFLVVAPLVAEPVIGRFQEPEAGEVGRVTLWRAGLALVADRPFGAGIGNGSLELPPYLNDLVETDVVGERVEFPAHNPIIEVGTDSGIVAMALYTAGLAGAAVVFLVSYRRAARLGARVTTSYCGLVLCMSVAFVSGWIKGGGLATNSATFVLLALWLVPSVANLEPVASGVERRPDRGLRMVAASATP